jgi:hypothetical protein
MKTTTANMRSAAERRVECNSERLRNNREFRRAGEAWLRACLEGPHIHSAKTLAAYLFLHFNYQRWRETGVLDAGGQGGEFGGLGFRRISEGTFLTHKSISRAVKALEAADLLRVVHAPRDPATGFGGANSYFAKFPSKSNTAVSSRYQVAVSPRYRNLCVTSDLNIPYAKAYGTRSLREPGATNKFDTPEVKKGVAEEVTTVTPQQTPDDYWVGYTEDEAYLVRHAISNCGIATVGGVVAYAKETNCWITGNVISNMVRDGYLCRDGDRIWLPNEDEDAT